MGRDRSEGSERRRACGNHPGQFLALAGFLLSGATGGEAAVVINEVQASNVGCLLDIDQDTPDWIELYNTGSVDQHLGGWTLSDKGDDPGGWVFPDLILPSGGHLLVFTSDKDRRVAASHWESPIDWGDPWRYRANTSPLPEGWLETDFDDSAWSEGPTGIGWGDGDDATAVPPCRSVSARCRFDLEDPTSVQLVCLHMDFDDAFVAWLNGVEIARMLIGTPGEPPTFNAHVLGRHEAELFQGLAPERFVFDAAQLPLRAGSNVLTVQVQNYWLDVDLSLIPILSLGRASAPAGTRGVSEAIRYWVPHLHTDFKISASGEILVLRDAQGQRVDSVETGKMEANTSWGRSPDGAADWRVFDEPTPEAPNGDGYPLAQAEPPAFSAPGGFQSDSVSVTLSAPAPARVHYTLDGSEPTEDSSEFTEPIALGATTVLRARSFHPGCQPSEIVTQTYLFDDVPDMPVVCLATDPGNLWDPLKGIYVTGPEAQPTFPYWNANFWMDWERPVHVEFIDPLGGGFGLDLGMQIHGGVTRAFPQKSLRLAARGGYEASSIDWQVFPDLPVTSFKRLILRNAGNDWCVSHLRDGYLHRLARDLGLEVQAWRPARVYLNGAYWGIHNLRERVDRFYLESNQGVDPDEVDLLENDRIVVDGSTEQYDELRAFIAGHDLTDSTAFAELETMMDVENFATYYIFRVYFANTDWPGNNTRYWKSHEPGSRWRWIMYDTELGLGLNPEGAEHNTLAYALDDDSADWRNAPWSTELARRLLENAEFRRAFINRYADLLNSTLLPERLLPALDEIAGEIAAEIPRHMVRWGRSPASWTMALEEIRTFLRRRPALARVHVMQQFGLADTARLTLDVTPPGAGAIRLNAARVEGPWSGIYFAGVPIELTAEPAPGWHFRAWSDAALGQSAGIRVSPENHPALTAAFARDPDGSCGWLEPLPKLLRPAMTLHFHTWTGGRARAVACDVTGRCVADLLHGDVQAGEHEIAWTGLDDGGRPLASGVYFLHLEVGGSADACRIVVVRGR